MLTADPLQDHSGKRWLRSLGYLIVGAAVLLGVVLWWQGHPAILAPAAAVLAVAMPLSRRLPAPAAATAAFILVMGFYLAAAVGLGLTQLSVPVSPAVSLGVLLAPSARRCGQRGHRVEAVIGHYCHNLLMDGV